MKLFGGFRAENLVSELVKMPDPSAPGAEKTVNKIKKLGAPAIPAVIDALALSDKTHTMVLVDILSAMANDRTLDQFREGLADGNERVVSGTSWALSSSTDYSPNKLLDFFEDDEVSKGALIDILRVHKDDLSVHELLQRAYDLEPKEKAAVFKIIEEMVKPDMVPDLIARMGGKDPVIKMHLMRLLTKFDKDEIVGTLEIQLKDPNKMVRAAALKSLATRGQKLNVEPISKCLTDPDLDVQSRAVDVLINANHPDTIKYLLPALKDESEYARRAAVEVLNEIGTVDSVKDLLEAIKDDDWWVRSRAGDALAEIGGPKVVDAVVALIRDKDEETRRTAIEILNSMKDERAVDALIKATGDDDWWVRERAVDALSQIGNPKALPVLEDMLGKHPKTDNVVIRAIAKLGGSEHITRILPMLQRPEREVQIEAIKALSHLADQDQAETVRGVLNKIKQLDDQTIIGIADGALRDLDARFSQTVLEENIRAEKIGENTRTLLLDDGDLDKLLKEAKEASAVAMIEDE
ncbi:MAG: HEAT repeat domain-containing protein, partial [Woeseiaceae bacterium]|nr:HEAT repeat domain-containing protein [Woeseiaceae bacterium]